MNDTLREFTSYGSFVMPLLSVQHTVKPALVRWGGADQYFLDFRAPQKKYDTLVVYLHGGGWNSGTPTKFRFIGQKFALEGYDCILLSYRKTPDYHDMQLLTDVCKGYSIAKKYLRKHKRTYKKVVVVGSSAGAHLGTMLCLHENWKRKYGIPQDEFDGLISLAGPLCFDRPQTAVLNTLMRALFDSSAFSDWKRGEPMAYLHTGVKTKMLVIQSPHDGLVGLEQAEIFCRRALSLGVQAELYEVDEKRNTHSAYSAGIFLPGQEDSPALQKLLHWLKILSS